MTTSHDARTRRRRRSTTKKALLVGISYRKGTEGSDQAWGCIPTSIPNVKKFKKFIQGKLSLSPRYL